MLKKDLQKLQKIKILISLKSKAMTKGDDFLQRIKQEEPIPKWRFRLVNVSIWLGAILFVLVGAAAFSIVLFSIQQTDFSVIGHMSHSRFELFLGVLPLFWLILLIIFLGMAMMSIQKTKRGYKYTIIQLLIFSFSFSVLIGTAFFVYGGAQKLEHAFDIRVSAYESIQEKKKLIWMNPADGFLSGEIISAKDNQLILKGFDGKIWTVEYKGVFVPPILNLESGEKLKIIGKLTGDHLFLAEEIRPWGGMEMMRKRRGGLKR